MNCFVREPDNFSPLRSIYSAEITIDGKINNLQFPPSDYVALLLYYGILQSRTAGAKSS
jgi:hypothetical protein